MVIVAYNLSQEALQYEEDSLEILATPRRIFTKFRALILWMVATVSIAAGLFVLLDNLPFFLQSIYLIYSEGITSKFQSSWTLPYFLASSWAMTSLLLGSKCGLDRRSKKFLGILIAFAGLTSVLGTLLVWSNQMNWTALPDSLSVALHILSGLMICIAYLWRSFGRYEISDIPVLEGSVVLAAIAAFTLLLFLPQFDIAAQLKSSLETDWLFTSVGKFIPLLKAPAISSLLFLLLGLDVNQASAVDAQVHLNRV